MFVLDQTVVNLPRHLDQSAIGLPDRDYYLKNDGNLMEVRVFYAKHVARMLGLAGVPPREVAAAAADVMRIETKLARLQQDKVERRDPYRQYHPTDRAGLRAAAKGFPWDDYLGALGLQDVQAMYSTPPLSFFTGLDALIHAEPPAAWRHYLTWQIVRTESARLTSAIQDEAFAFEQKITGQKELAPRWKRCVADVDEELGELLAQPYVVAKFGGDSKARAEALVRSIRDAMRIDLVALPWMDETTRAAAIAKLDRIHEKVGYPSTWRTYDFPIARASYAANAMEGDRAEVRHFLSARPENRSTEKNGRRPLRR